MPKICEHLLNLKIQKIANYFNKCQLSCTGNKNHSNSSLDICLSCGQTRCLSYQTSQCSYQHSYGTKHPLCYRSDNKSIYCFNCQQDLNQSLNLKQQNEVSNAKLEKISDAYSRILEMSKKFHERLQEKPIATQVDKKGKKQKAKVEAKQKERSLIKQEKQIKENESQIHLTNQLQVFGLKNLGNTCFFNSTLQCLYATQALHTKYEHFDFDQRQQFGKIGEINILFRKFLKNNEKQFTPKGLFAWACKSKGIYKHMDQQDAQELLGVLLNGLIDGQKFWLGQEKLKELNKQKKNTITQKLFGFYLASRLQCLQCNKISWSLDFSLEVAVSLSKTFNKKIPLPQGEISLKEINEEGLFYPKYKESGCIIDTFFVPQYLGKDNYFTCQTCKSQKAIRKFYIKDPPSILIMTLKRFNNNLSKNNADVKVAPILHLQGHCINPGVHQYQVYAMIVHNGTAKGGHYTACSKRGENWFYFSDTTLKPIPWQKVRTSQPYILFYRRINE